MRPGKIVKVKLIGSKDASKPFWAYADDVDRAIELCAQFMHDSIFGAEHDSYEEVYNTILKSRFIEAYQPECGFNGQIVEYVYPAGKRHYSFNRKRRIYNQKLYQYLARGYYQVPRIKLYRCKIEDRSGIHCKSDTDIAIILMRDIICPYFANTIKWAEEHDNFSISMYLHSTGSEYEFVDPKNILLVMFASWMNYQDHLSSIGQLSRKCMEVMGRFSRAFASLISYSLPFPTAMLADDFGSFSISYMSEGPKEDVFTYSREKSKTHGDELPISENIPLHFFDDISEFTKHCINQGERARSCHISITISERFWPKALVERIQRL